MLSRLLIVLSIALLISSCKEEIMTTKEDVIPSDCGSFSWFQSKDTTGFYYYLTGARLLPLEVDTSGHNLYYCRILKNQIVFDINAEYRRFDSTIKGPGSGGDEPIAGIVVNPVTIGKSSFSFNKDILFHGSLIKAYENILSHKEISYPEFFFDDSVWPFAIGQVHMDKNAFRIDKGLYTVTATWTTSDNKVLKASVDVYFDLSQ